MVFFGYIEGVRRGETFQNVMACHSTISSRFYRWRAEGLWQQMCENLIQQADAVGDIDWEVHFIDSTVVRAHQHAAGAKGGIQKSRLWDVALVASALKYT
jgi:transposase